MKSVLTDQVLILFLLMLVGFIARKKKLLNNELNAGITEILLNITTPFMIVASFNLKFSSSIFHNAIILFGAAVMAHMISILVGFLIFRKGPVADRKILQFVTIFSNTGFMGLPVLGSLFGPMGVFYGSIYVVVFNIFVWSLGVWIFTGKEGFQFWKVLANPALIGVFIGFIIFLGSISLPAPLFQTLDMIGSMTTPLSMIIIGSMLTELKLKELFTGWTLYFGVAFRLLIMPLLTAFLLYSLSIPEYLLKICVTSVAMPAATMTAIFSEKYHGNTILASRIIFITTALSLLTIPIISMIIEFIYE
ncbi:MAG TPA: AEC family transporter [Firmicutes bacterium]|jgi:malate permease and related proteins|nr:AEC family transporter [Bacillota bacterium]